MKRSFDEFIKTNYNELEFTDDYIINVLENYFITSDFKLYKRKKNEIFTYKVKFNGIVSPEFESWKELNNILFVVDI